MKKFFKFYLGIIIFSLSVNFAHAEDEILSETVKIISYNLTENNHVLEEAYASGTLISSDGLILTNHHVVTDNFDESYEAFAICVVIDEQEKPECKYTASLIAKNKSLDIALLKINNQDIYGNTVTTFPYLNYENAVLPEVSSQIEMIGFPGIGGDTITKTKGQVSGFDEKEGFKQIKTDAAVSPGNSGGTVVDNNGNFIGVPSYLKSYYSTLGYIVPLTEINPWLKEIIAQDANIDEFAINLLEKTLQTKENVEKNRSYTSNIYPYYSINIPKPWNIDFVNDTSIDLSNTVSGTDLYLSFNTNPIPFKFNDDYMNFILKKIEKNYHLYTNYQRKEYTIDGKTGYLLSYDYSNTRNYYFLAGIDNTLFAIQYNISLENRTETENAIQAILDSLTFEKKTNNIEKMLQSYHQERPNISIKTFNDFYIVPTYNSSYENEIVSIENPNSFEQSFYIDRYDLPKDYWELSKKEILDKELKYEYGQLINKNDNVVIDGLEGFAYTHSSIGDDFNQTIKTTKIFLLADKKYFEFIYSDLEENYDKNIDTFIKTLENFEYDGPENVTSKGEYNIPQFKMYYEDINNYIYESQINSLASKDILNIKGNYFYPEYEIHRMEALEAILDSKIFIEEGRNLTETKEAIESASESSDFQDIIKKNDHKMLNYALNKGIVSQNTKFHPYNDLTLAEALKMLCITYELPVWNPPYADIEWYVPYIHKGYMLGIIPLGAEYDKPLTRGQFAALLYDFVSIVGERSDL